MGGDDENVPSFVFTTPFCFPPFRNRRGRTTGRKWWRPWRSGGCHSAIDVVFGDLVSGILFFELKKNNLGGSVIYVRNKPWGSDLTAIWGGLGGLTFHRLIPTVSCRLARNPYESEDSRTCDREAQHWKILHLTLLSSWKRSQEFCANGHESITTILGTMVSDIYLSVRNGQLHARRTETRYREVLD